MSPDRSCSLKSLRWFVPSHCSSCLLAFLTHNLYLPKYLLTLAHAGIYFFTAIKTTGGWALESYNSFVPPEYSLYMIMNKCMNQLRSLSYQAVTCYRFTVFAGCDHVFSHLAVQTLHIPCDSCYTHTIATPEYNSPLHPEPFEKGLLVGEWYQACTWTGQTWNHRICCPCLHLCLSLQDSASDAEIC